MKGGSGEQGRVREREECRTEDRGREKERVTVFRWRAEFEGFFFSWLREGLLTRKADE